MNPDFELAAAIAEIEQLRADNLRLRNERDGALAHEQEDAIVIGRLSSGEELQTLMRLNNALADEARIVFDAAIEAAAGIHDAEAARLTLSAASDSLSRQAKRFRSDRANSHVWWAKAIRTLKRPSPGTDT